jgi:HTH-type transcriptional regulator/antitoxin HigA
MIEPVVDPASHQRALRRIEQLWDAKPNSAKERELDALATLVDAYERRAFPIRELGPIEAIKARCEQLGWTRRQLEPLIGSRARVSEVLSGRRALTLPMIRRINERLGIPAEVLISESRSNRVQTMRRGPAKKKRIRHPTASAAQQGVAPDGRSRRRSSDRR